MNTETNWVVLTGPPSSGKTTLLRLFADAGEQISADSTRRLISEVVASGRDAEEFRFADDFQPRVLSAMASAEAQLESGQRTFIEYALPCNIAFHRTENRVLTPGLDEAAERYRYSNVFILDPVGWQSDAERVEGEAYQAEVHEHLFDVYRELGYEPIRLPAVSPTKRYDLVRDHLKGRGF